MRTAILFLSFGTGLLMAWTLLLPAGGRQMVDRLRRLRRFSTVVASPATIEEEELAIPFAQRVLRPLWEAALRRAAALMPRQLQQAARLRLAQAGVYMDPSRFVGLQATVAGCGAVAALVLMTPAWLHGRWLMALPVAALGAAAGWRVPGLGLVRLVQERKRALQKALPDVLDLLSISVEAGLGFDGAIQKVAEKFAEPVAGEFREFLKEVRLGRTRAASLRAMADRTAVPDFQSFAAAVIQADQLGVSIARVLRSQAESARVRRRQRAEERAMQLPLKLLFPLIFFIFPTLFIVILGPLVIQFLTVFRR